MVCYVEHFFTINKFFKQTVVSNSVDDSEFGFFLFQHRIFLAVYLLIIMDVLGSV